jgi:hypothetical protein
MLILFLGHAVKNRRRAGIFLTQLLGEGRVDAAILFLGRYGKGKDFPFVEAGKIATIGV